MEVCYSFIVLCKEVERNRYTDTSIVKLSYFVGITNSLEYLDFFVFLQLKNQKIHTFPFKVRPHIQTIGSFVMSYMDKECLFMI